MGKVVEEIKVVLIRIEFKKQKKKPYSAVYGIDCILIVGLVLHTERSTSNEAVVTMIRICGIVAERCGLNIPGLPYSSLHLSWLASLSPCLLTLTPTTLTNPSPSLLLIFHSAPPSPPPLHPHISPFFLPLFQVPKQQNFWPIFWEFLY